MNKKIIAITILSLMLVLAGCSTQETKSVSQEQINIAVAAPFTGDYAQYGESFKKAIDLHVKSINEKGGVKGAKINIEIFDDKNDAKEATNIAQKLVSDKKFSAVIGHFGSTPSMAAAPIYLKGGLVEFSPTSSHPEFTSQGEYMFRNINTQAIEGPILAEYAVNSLNKKKIAVIYINNDWGVVTKDKFEEKAKALGADIVASEPFIGGQTKDFTPTLTKIKELQPDLLFIAAMYSDTGLILQQAKQLQFDVTILGPSSLNNEQLIKMAGEAAEGVYLTSNFFPQDPSEKVKSFVEAYKQAYAVEPDQFAAVAYDTIGILAQAIEVGGTDRKAIRDALAQVKDYDGITGKTSFNENRDVEKEVVVLKIEGGKFMLVE
jgi:branched-chain amino acid transport system substrate-binding protein